MKRVKTFILQLPEYLLITAVLFYWFSTGLAVNYIAIGLIIVLILQIIFKRSDCWNYNSNYISFDMPLYVTCTNVRV